MQQSKIEPLLNYSEIGFDKYLQRSINTMLLIGGGASGVGRSLNFDQVQTTGNLGSKFQVGKIMIDGTAGNIIVNDGENDVLLLGYDSEGF